MAAAPATRVAVLGTGTLGAPMARNVAATGVEVTVWNRTAERTKPLADAGLRVCASVAEAVADADLVLTMLSDTTAVSSVMRDHGGLEAMTPGAVWVQSSTVGIQDTEGWAGAARTAGVAFVDSPVLGTRTPAENGQLVLLASGPDEAREVCRPVFEAIGKRTLWLGAAGTGTRLKLVVNTWLLSLVEVLAESVAFAKAMGFDAETFFATIEQGGVSLPYVRLKGSAMDREEFPPDFTLRLARKDLRLVLDAAADAGLPVPVVEAVVRQFDRAIGLGHGDADYAATYLATRSES
ncbi:NAD(P)-dependent oxidoreductase [Streptomyces sp. NA02950]|uniref:NAD(P)-dependent oxidoreductase n=1 Tax=Streptomyces sp. NA02950 TaxID=2742137 RepID=UPI001592293B|nr:NAD(P)-dependent oxidoreductase [Streptomyces sp. NA02950]QKV96395.1 NAD(P)-dependent oxidoreductase [Streptomyces sp. NA02950]